MKPTAKPIAVLPVSGMPRFEKAVA